MGGDGFSKYDLMYDILGIGVAHILDKVWNPKEKRNDIQCRFNRHSFLFTFRIH